MKNRNGSIAKIYLKKGSVAKPLFVIFVIAVVITGELTVTNFIQTTAISATTTAAAAVKDDTPIELRSIFHYATSTVVPQQSREEIRVTFDVIKSLSPSNFLVFGLGHDSLMWSSFNPRGTTLFLEEDRRWLQRILTNAPALRAYHVKYDTRLSDADALLSSYRFEPRCLPPDVNLRGNTRCKLALSRLPDEAYDNEWDVIMVDGPRGYFPEAPGRMAVIFSAAVMARSRMRPGVTHVILHDVNRKVENAFAKEFLCEKYLVKAVGRLWHFEIPSAAANVSSGSRRFC